MHIHKYLTLIALAVLCGCSSSDEPAGKSGVGCVKPSVVVSSDIVSIGRGSDVNPADFSLTLTSVKGDYTQTWDKVSDFSSDKNFAIGDYTLSASYGDVDIEGYNAPCYKGETSVTIMEATTSTATVTCTLANAIVSVATSEAFNNYFTGSEITLATPAGGAFAMNDETPVYIKPGDASLEIAVTTPQGNVARFARELPEIKARHHYRVRLDVNNGEIGSASIIISFDNSTTTQDITVDLTGDILED